MRTIPTKKNQSSITITLSRGKKGLTAKLSTPKTDLPAGDTCIETDFTKGKPNVTVTAVGPKGSSVFGFTLGSSGATSWNGASTTLKGPTKGKKDHVETNQHQFILVVTNDDGSVDVFDPIYVIRRIGY